MHGSKKKSHQEIKYQKKVNHLLSNLMNKKSVAKVKIKYKYIVSLTSYGKRLETVWITIQSILEQKCKIAKIVLWVAYQDKDLINEKLRLLEKKGLEIKYCEDIRSYKKLIYNLKFFKNYHIITIDDDVIYPRNYIVRLIKLHMKHPKCICCYRAHTIQFSNELIKPYKKWHFHSVGIKGPSHNIIAIGIGGILYPAGLLKYEYFDMDIINHVAPYTDDIYFKWIELTQKIKVVKVYKYKKHIPYYIEGTQENSLKSFNIIHKNNNDISINNLEKFFNKSFYSLLNENLNFSDKIQINT